MMFIVLIKSEMCFFPAHLIARCERNLNVLPACFPLPSLSLSLWECFPYLLSYSTERSTAPLPLLMFLAYLCALFLKLTPLFTPVEKADTKQGRQQHSTTLVTEAKQSSHILSCLELVLSQTFTSEEEKLTR